MALKKTPVYGGLWGDTLLGVEAPQRDIRLVEVPFDTAAVIIRRRFHIESADISFLVEWMGETHGAVMLWETEPGVMEVERMWLSDTRDGSVVISLIHLWLRLARPDVRLVQSWADEGDATYRTAGYRFVREVVGGLFRLPDGRQVHRLDLWRMHGEAGERWEWLCQRYPGIKIVTDPQRLYQYAL